MPNELFYKHSLDRSISNIRGVWLVLILPCFIEIHVFKANSADPDQTPRSAASDLSLHCLQLSHLWDARLKWVKGNNTLLGVTTLFRRGLACSEANIVRKDFFLGCNGAIYRCI